MATLFESYKGLIHDTASALIDQEIPKQVSDVVTSFVSSSFAIMGDALKIVQKLTEPTAEAPPPPPSP
jgi:hypothetical protein